MKEVQYHLPLGKYKLKPQWVTGICLPVWLKSNRKGMVNQFEQMYSMWFAGMQRHKVNLENTSTVSMELNITLL